MPNLSLANVLALWIVGAVLMVPLAGMTARWGLAPVLRAVARVRRAAPDDLDELRGEVRALAASVDRLAAALAREPAPY